jgi:hypothetical protein
LEDYYACAYGTLCVLSLSSSTKDTSLVAMMIDVLPSKRKGALAE